MPISFSAPSTRPGSERSQLHPLLSAALSSLDMDLDAELDRYQRLTQTAGLSAGLAVVNGAVAEQTALEREIDRAIVPVAAAAGDSTDAAVDGALSALGVDATVGPDTYLESSEELLRSLDTPAASSRTSPSVGRILSDLITPLGVGLMLLVGLSSLTLTYGILSFRSVRMARQVAPPEKLDGDRDALPPLSPNLALGEFTTLTLGRLSTLPSLSPDGRSEPRLPQVEADAVGAPDGDALPDAAAAEDPVAPSSNASVAPLQVTPPVQPAAPQPQSSRSRGRRTAAAPPAPPIAAASPTEAIAGASRNNAPTAAEAPVPSPARSPESQPTPAAQSATTPATTSAETPSSADDRSRSQSASTESEAASPPSAPSSSATAARSTVPAASSTPASPSAPSSGTAEAYHHVVVPYTGDRSLEQAREAVSGAYVRNFSNGAQVQLGAFESESRAEQFVNELAGQGIDATIRPE